MTERVLAEVTLSGAALEAYRGGLPLAHCMESPDVRYRVIPARPADKVLGDAIELADDEASYWENTDPPWPNSAREYRDLAAQLRALAAGPTADDYEAAIEELLDTTSAGDDVGAGMVQALLAAKDRARELAAERVEGSEA